MSAHKLGRVRVVLIAIAAMMVGCAQQLPTANQTGACAEIMTNLPKNPRREADMAFSRGDRRFLAVHGFTIVVPGIEDEELIAGSGYRIIEGTGDAAKDESCIDYQREATSFARSYNMRVMELLSE